MFRPLAKMFGYDKRFEHVWVQPSGDQLAKVAQFLDDGSVHPVIGEAFSLDQAKLAYQSVDQNACASKTVLRVAS